MGTNGFHWRYVDPRAIEWYKSLDIHKKIYVKTSFELMCGMKFSTATKIFDLMEIITIFHNKLISEGVKLPPPAVEELEQ